MVYLGPQLVQLIKGYSNRRSAGSCISLRQSGHTPTSGEIKADLVWVSRLLTILKSVRCKGCVSVDTMPEICDSSGFFSKISKINASKSFGAPWIKIATPKSVLDTWPQRWYVQAKPNKKGRNPTPWTTPEISIFFAAIPEEPIYKRQAGSPPSSSILRMS